MTRAISVCLLVLGAALWVAGASSARPEGLLVEYRENPIGIDAVQPHFSWRMADTRRGARQTAYQIRVGSRPGRADMWDSGKVASAEAISIPYAGKPLKSQTRYWWQVRIWDGSGVESRSDSAFFEMALLDAKEWEGQWIATPISLDSEGKNGYHSEFAPSADTAKWVQVDLGAVQAFREVALYPARPFNWSRDEPGFGFPVRYRIEVCNEPGFKSPRVIADRTGADQPNPGKEPVRIPVGDQQARYVRLVAARLDWPKGAQGAMLALAEMEVLDSAGNNIARNASVSASDSVESSGWNRVQLTDGVTIPRGPGATAPASPLVRHEFRLDKPIARARAYVTGLGYYELHINGQRVGDRVLDPPFTNFDKRIYYSTYDVTALLRRGDNCVSAILGQGWWRKTPRLLLQLNVTYTDGTTARIVSNGDWRWTPSPILENSIYNGEIYDAREELPGWDRPGFDGSRWGAVEPVTMPATVLSAETIQPIRVVGSITPRRVSNPKPGIYVFDMGQNFSGWCRLKVKGPAGTRVSMRHAELLYPDGTVNQENLRSARATDTYILSGRGEETYEPRFTYHGFRYVQVEGYPGVPALGAVLGREVHTALEPRGSFSCSNELINQVQRASEWTFRCNFHSIPTDCPQRDERQGWMGDAHIAAYMAMYNYNMPPAYSKFVQDIQDAQGEDGRIPDTVPHIWGSDPGDPMWAIAYHVILWEMYRHTGDRSLLARHYDSARHYTEMLRREAQDFILTRNNYGDWISVVPTPNDLISTGTYYLTVKLTAEMAEALGKRDDAREYFKLSRQIASAFNARFLDPKTARYGNGSQLSNAFPLYLGIVPAQYHQAVLDALARNILEERKGHLSTGLVGTRFLMEVLTREGRGDVAYTIASQEDYPGWGYMIRNGATTIWELWNLATGRGMNSHSHPWAACVSGWFYEGQAGIRPDPAHPGWERAIIQPNVVGDLKWARGSVQTLRGTVSSKWERQGNGLRLDVTIPANAQATVYVPKLGKAHPRISEDGKTIWQDGVFMAADGGIASARDAGEYVAFEVGAGAYSFELR